MSQVSSHLHPLLVLFRSLLCHAWTKVAANVFGRCLPGRIKMDSQGQLFTSVGCVLISSRRVHKWRRPSYPLGWGVVRICYGWVPNLIWRAIWTDVYKTWFPGQLQIFFGQRLSRSGLGIGWYLGPWAWSKSHINIIWTLKTRLVCLPYTQKTINVGQFHAFLGRLYSLCGMALET